MRVQINDRILVDLRFQSCALERTEIHSSNIKFKCDHDHQKTNPSDQPHLVQSSVTQIKLWERFGPNS